MTQKRVLQLSLKISRLLQKIELVAGMFCLAVMLTVIVLNIIFRYVLFKPFAWSDELSNYLFIWMSFLASAYVMGEDNHVRVTAIEQRLPKRIRNIVHLIMNVIMLLVFLWYIAPSFGILKNLRRSNMLRVPLKYVYLIIPIAFSLMALHVISNIFLDLNRLHEEMSSRKISKQMLER
jgi:TRAP-type C4-dicarboxylate transport system permease small subunit